METASKRKPRRLRKFAFFAVAIFIAVGSLAVLYHDELREQYRHFVRGREEAAVKHCGAELPGVDEVRLLRLDDLGSSPSLGTYTIPSHEPTQMTIVAEKTLLGAEAEQFAALWRKQYLTLDAMASCHDPHHVLQFRRNGSKVADVVICFICENAAIPAFPSWTLVGLLEGPPPLEPHAFSELKTAVEAYVGAYDREKLVKKLQSK